MSGDEAHHVLMYFPPAREDCSEFYLDSIGFQLKEMRIPERMTGNLVDIAISVAGFFPQKDAALKAIDASLGGVGRILNDERRLNSWLSWPFQEFEFRQWCCSVLGLDVKKYENVPKGRTPEYMIARLLDSDSRIYDSFQQERIGRNLRLRRVGGDGRNLQGEISQIIYHGGGAGSV